MPCCSSNQKSGASESASPEIAKVAQENETKVSQQECCERKPERSKQCGCGC